MRTDSEPSGIRLMRLINTRILDIARHEQTNTDRLCLYGTGGWWTAFDRSAFALSRLFPDLDSFVVNPPGCPFSVVGLTLSEKILKKFIRKREPAHQDLDYIELTLDQSLDRHLDVSDDQTYQAWHTQIVKSFSDIINDGTDS